MLDVTTYSQQRLEVTLSLEVPEGWLASPIQTSFTLDTGETRRISIDVSVPEWADLDTYMLAVKLQYSGTSRERSFEVTVVERSYAYVDEVYVILGETNQPNGLVQIEQEDGQTAADTVYGR